MPTRVVLALARAFDQLGCAGSARLVGSALGPLDDPDGRIPYAAVTAYCEGLIAEAGDPDIGLQLGMLVPFGSRPLLDNLFAASATLGDALTVVDRFSHLQTRAMGYRRSVDAGETVRYSVTAAPGVVTARWQIDFMLARAVADVRQALRENVRPSAVYFNYPRPPNLKVHRQILASPLYFAADEAAVEVHRSMLERPLPAANASLHELLEGLAEAADAATRSTPSAPGLSPLRAYVAGHLRDGLCTLTAASRALGMSTRTLRRRLAEQDTSFQSEVDRVRAELATQYLARTELSLGDISYALGFANVTAFHRAFKRWQGQTAASYRASASR